MSTHSGRKPNQRTRDIAFFHSQTEMSEDLPCKVYQITQDWGRDWDQWDNLWDHTHDYLQIWYVRKGAFFHTINGERYRMVKGNLFVVPPFAVHRVDLIPDEEMDVIGCEFLPHFVSEGLIQTEAGKELFDFGYLEHFLVNEEEVSPKVALAGSTDMEVQRLLETMLTEYTARDAYFELHLKANLLKLLAILVRAYGQEMDKVASSTSKEYYRSVRIAVDYMQTHFHQDLRLEDVCRVAMLSKTYFSYLFKNVTGKTFNEYLIDIRIRQAMDLLLDKSLRVTAVATQVGFNDATYFSRVFKRHTGISPSQYRQHAVADRTPRKA